MKEPGRRQIVEHDRELDNYAAPSHRSTRMHRSEVGIMMYKLDYEPLLLPLLNADRVSRSPRDRVKKAIHAADTYFNLQRKGASGSFISQARASHETHTAPPLSSPSL